MNHNMQPRAIAVIRGGGTFPRLRGTARFYQRSDGVIVEVDVAGLPGTGNGFYGLHIHEGGSCGGVDFGNSGTHFNPARVLHPNHAGDLPPLLGSNGRAYMKVFTGRFRIPEIIGRTVVIHSDPDDFRTQPAGNSGRKLACGVIQRVRVPPSR